MTCSKVAPDLRAGRFRHRSPLVPLRGRTLRAAFVVVGLFTLASSAFAAPTYRNLFTELLGKSDAEVSAKIDRGFQQLFHGHNDSERIYYPVDGDMAYMADIGNGDVRSEGMSYGMMIAVQMDRREEFDRLWKWARTYMYHAEGPRRGYFAWQCAFSGQQIDPGSASDGEVWIATVLFFAAHRWGNGEGIFNYAAEAQALLREMLHKPVTEEFVPIFNREQKQVVFVPNRFAGRFTDPSYHMPAFYELWAQWSDNSDDRTFWKDAAHAGRAYFRKAAHPKTGLMPEYAYFDGRPFTEDTFGPGKNDFRYDAWRTLAHVALDYAWFAADPWQVEQSNRVLRFLASHGETLPHLFTLDGQPLIDTPSIGLTAMAAVAGLAAEPELARIFVQRLWDAEIPSHRWRYYNGLLYQMALLQVSGRFIIHGPLAP